MLRFSCLLAVIVLTSGSVGSDKEGRQIRGFLSACRMLSRAGLHPRAGQEADQGRH